MINPEYAHQRRDVNLRRAVVHRKVDHVGLRRLLLQSSVASIALLSLGDVRAHAACVESAPGTGTKFVVMLPAISESELALAD